MEIEEIKDGVIVKNGGFSITILKTIDNEHKISVKTRGDWYIYLVHFDETKAEIGIDF